MSLQANVWHFLAKAIFVFLGYFFVLRWSGSAPPVVQDKLGFHSYYFSICFSHYTNVLRVLPLNDFDPLFELAFDSCDSGGGGKSTLLC